MLYLSKKLLATATLLVSFTGSVFADHIEIDKPWLPEAAPVARVMAAYMDIRNHGSKTSYITAITSPQFRKVEIHSMMHKNGMMHMEKQDKLAIPAGETVSLQPGGFHMMLFNPKKWYQAGSKITLNITIDNNHTFQVISTVKKDHDDDNHHHH